MKGRRIRGRSGTDGGNEGDEGVAAYDQKDVL
jgi:hypothetical protein